MSQSGTKKARERSHNTDPRGGGWYREAPLSPSIELDDGGDYTIPPVKTKGINKRLGYTGLAAAYTTRAVRREA